MTKPRHFHGTNSHKSTVHYVPCTKKHGDKENEWLVSQGETDFYETQIESSA